MPRPPTTRSKSNKSIDLLSFIHEGMGDMVELKMMKRLAALVTVVLAGVLLSGCQSTGSNPDFQAVELGTPQGSQPEVATNSNPQVGIPNQSVFNIGDLVVVNFSGLSSSELIPPHEERIKEDGNITLPLIGAVHALGKGPGELQKEIRARYVDGKFYNETLNVTVRGQDRFFFVGGEVRGPGRQVYVEGMTVLKAIQSAGDFTDFARKTRVSVTRSDGSKLTINCVKAIENPELDVPVYPGDRVHVPRSWY